MVFAAGGELTAAALNAALDHSYARWERTSGTQAAASSANTQLQFPTGVAAASAVTASGTSNAAFTVASGLWLANVSCRLTTDTATGQLSIAVGSTTWSSGAIQNISGSGSGNLHVCSIVDARAAPVAVTANLWQTSGGTMQVGALGGATSISFLRIGG